MDGVLGYFEELAFIVELVFSFYIVVYLGIFICGNNLFFKRVGNNYNDNDDDNIYNLLGVYYILYRLF